MDYVKELLRAINTYDENDSSSQDRLRDLVCTISDSHELKKDSLISQLIYVASQKMRVFGYNKQNKFDEDPNSNISLMGDLKNKAIEELYRSEASEEVILDKTQKEIVEGFNFLERKRMLVSAPTSYGKTFLMREILYLNKSRYNNILLVFPTIALLRENASTMTSFVNEKELNYNIIKSVRSEIDPKGRNILCLRLKG